LPPPPLERRRAAVDMPSWDDGESSEERLGVSSSIRSCPSSHLPLWYAIRVHHNLGFFYLRWFAVELRCFFCNFWSTRISPPSTMLPIRSRTPHSPA
jgi:hypothetical protein